MRLKPTAARRLLLLAVVGVVIIGGAVAFVGVRSWQRERRIHTWRADGMAAFQRHDDFGTIDNLSRMLRQKPDDREAWLAFAEARERVEEPRGQHIMQAILGYSRALALDEADAKTARKLLKLYNTVGQFPEAKALAARLRPKNLADAKPEDADVIREEVFARLASKDLGDSLDQLSKRLVELRPGDYDAAFLRCSALIAAEHKDDAVKLADELVAAHPGSAQLGFLRAMVRTGTGADTNTEEFVKAVCKAAGLAYDPKNPGACDRVADAAYTEPQFAAQLMATFDQRNLRTHALRVLKDSAERLHDPDARRLFARRAWQAAMPGEVVAEFAPDGADLSKVNPETLGFLALSERDLGKPDRAADILKLLKADDRSYLARTWSKLLTAVLETPDRAASLALIESAEKDNPAEPVFDYFRGEVLAALSRADEARTAWADVYKSPAAEGWAAPQVRIAETLLDAGEPAQLEPAKDAAELATRKSSSSAAASLVLLRAKAALIEAGRLPAKPAEVLKQLDKISANLSAASPQLATLAYRLFLPPKVILLCELGRRPEAVAAIEAAIAKPDTLVPDLARRLASACVRTGLKYEDRLLAASAGAAGAGDAGTLISRAMLMDSTGRRAEAIKLVDDAVAVARPDDLAGLSTARARFYDAIHDPKAPELWRKLLADFPQSLPAHIAMLRSNAVEADPALLEQVIARVTELGGSDADAPTADVRFARARALLHGEPTARNRDEAIALLRALIIEAPARLQFRDVLVGAYLMSDPGRNISPDPAGALEQLTAAAAVAPNRAPYIFRQADLLRDLHRTADAADLLARLALDQTADRDDRLLAVDRLSALSPANSDAALRAIDSLIGTSSPAPVDLLVRRAGLLTSQRRDREAIEAYLQIVDQPTDNVDALFAAANGLRSLGDQADAARAIKKLDQPEISPVTRSLVLGGLAAAAGDDAGALRDLTHATELAPDEARTWIALARFNLDKGNLDQAEAAAAAGLAKLPGDPQLAVMLEQVKLARQPEASVNLIPLADALEKIPGGQARAAAPRAVQKARQGGQLDDTGALVQLSEKCYDDATTQLFVARRLLDLKPPRLDKAAEVLGRAINRFPSDAKLQEQATRVFATIGDWKQARAAALAWRALGRSKEADMAVAESELGSGNSRAALDAVASYRLPTPIAESDRFGFALLNLRARAQAAMKDNAGALALLRPYLDTRAVRKDIVLLVAAGVVTPADEAQRWIELVAAAAKPDDPEEQFAIAGAWARLADRLPEVKADAKAAVRADLLHRATAILDTLASSDATARVFEAKAALLDASGDTPGAIAAARQAVAKDPKSASALVGLASRLLDSAADPAEAVALARQAAEAEPKQPAILALLAEAQLKLADNRAAAQDPSGSAAARKDAARTLEEFLSLKAADFRSSSGMGILAENLGNLPAAISCYESALRAGASVPAGNLAVVKNNLAFAIYSQAASAGTKDGLQRAKSLIDEAITVNQVGPFYDSLGAINAALGDRAAAMAAYRKSIELDARSITSAIGLADLLSVGSSADKAEARKLIDTADKALAAGAVISPERKQQLDATRARLAGG